MQKAYIKILEISERNPSVKVQHKPVIRSLSNEVIEAKTTHTTPTFITEAFRPCCLFKEMLMAYTISYEVELYNALQL